MSDETPVIRRIFIRVAPRIFPRLNSKLPFFTAIIEAINSGIEIIVPKRTTQIGRASCRERV